MPVTQISLTPSQDFEYLCLPGKFQAVHFQHPEKKQNRQGYDQQHKQMPPLINHAVEGGQVLIEAVAADQGKTGKSAVEFIAYSTDIGRGGESDKDLVDDPLLLLGKHERGLVRDEDRGVAQVTLFRKINQTDNDEVATREREKEPCRWANEVMWPRNLLRTSRIPR